MQTVYIKKMVVEHIMPTLCQEDGLECCTIGSVLQHQWTTKPHPFLLTRSIVSWNIQ